MSDIFKRLREANDGRLPAYAWPGGYPLYYLTADNGSLCPACANGANGSEACEKSGDVQWRLSAYEVHYERRPIACDHCGAQVESAYGPVPEQEEAT